MMPILGVTIALVVKKAISLRGSSQIGRRSFASPFFGGVA
jgi:hypothetical protein